MGNPLRCWFYCKLLDVCPFSNVCRLAWDTNMWIEQLNLVAGSKKSIVYFFPAHKHLRIRTFLASHMYWSAINGDRGFILFFFFFASYRLFSSYKVFFYFSFSSSSSYFVGLRFIFHFLFSSHWENASSLRRCAVGRWTMLICDVYVALPRCWSIHLACRSANVPFYR